MAEKQNRIVQLDVLRAVAILLVLGRHPVVAAKQAGALAGFAAVWERFGWTGVDLFFVLSGFLIGGLLYEELRTSSRLNLGRFLIRRGFKIWPAYYVFVAFLLVGPFWFEPIFPGAHGTVAQRLASLGPHLVHLQNYRGPIWLHTWSLAVEEHFYLAFPILLLLLTRLRSTPRPPSTLQVGLLATSAVVGCTYLRLRGKPTVPIDLTLSMVPTHLRIDGLLFGTTLAYVYHLKPTWFAAARRFKWPLLFVGMAALGPMMVLPIEKQPFVVTWGFSLLYLGYGCVILAVMSIDPNSRALRYVSRMFVTRVLLAIGISSYSTYLWHWHLARLPLMRFIATHRLMGGPEWNWLAYTVLYVVVATLVGHIAGILIEFPALRLRDRLFPRMAIRRARPTVEPTSNRLAG